MKKTEKTYNAFAFILFIIFIFSVFILRFFQLGILKTANGHDLTQQNVETYYGSSIHHARRGSLYDRSGTPIAMDTTSYSIHAKIKDDVGFEVVNDYDETAKLLSEYLDLDRDTIFEILMTPDVNQVEFGPAGKNLSAETMRQIADLNLPGIYFDENMKRQYINDYFSSHLVGYTTPVPAENNDFMVQEGVMGIELAFDDYLNQFETADNVSTLAVGQDLQLTIDSRLQNYLEDLITQTYERYQPEEVSVHLVELGSNDLIASAQRPTFNLNSREGIDDEWRLLLVENMFEPGSTIKVLTQAYAYDHKIYQPNEFVMTGSIDIYDTTVRDYNLEGWGMIPFDEGLVRSSNTSMVELVNRIGVNQWIDALESFGFGKSTESGLPNESTGSIDFDNPVSAIMSSFGQGLLVTPIQLLQAYSSIGNHGIMRSINYVTSMNETEHFSPKQTEKRLFEEKTAEHILNLLTQTVTSPFGTGADYHRQEMPVAVKTGTAQIANPDGPGYLTGDQDYYFSTVSYFPATDPKYMMLITLKRPTVSHGMTGNKMIAELFHPLVDYIMINE